MTTLRPRQLDAVLGAATALATMVVLGALVPAGTPARGVDAITLLLQKGWPAGLWVLAAVGLGSLLVRMLPVGHRDRGLRIGLGVAGLVVLDLALGGLGLLGRGDEVVAWAVVVILAPIAVADGWRDRSTDRATAPPTDVWRLAIPLGVPIGVLLLAATSTPGWLWATEFGGYDALSYHLQLPREWWFAGGIVETPHNAYGYLPGGMSAAFLHVMTLVGDPAAAAVSCQLLVAMLTIGAAAGAADLADTWAGDATSPTRRRLAMLVLLSTPWVIVTGSLAYDEAAVMLAAAAAAGMVIRAGDESTTDALRDARTGIALGIVLALSVLAKASSGVLVIGPIAIAAAIILPSRRWPAVVIGTAIAGVACSMPWLLRNGLWTGNPVFPFAADLLGAGDWTEEQVRRFAAGHASPGVVDGAVALIREFLLDDLAGGLPSGEPWRPQWWWLPIVGLASIAWSMRGGAVDDDPPRRRRIGRAMLAMVLVALVAWAFATHAKARFLLPLTPILAAVTALAWRDLAATGSTTRRALAGLAWLTTLAPIVMFATERAGMPAAAIGADDLFDGRREAAAIAVADPRTAAALRAEASRAFVLRDLDPTARVLLVGVAEPWHLAIEDELGGATRFSYTTVWCRGPLERALDAAGDRTPEACAANAIAILRSKGFTHVLVAPTMLEVWSRSGWLDPALDPDRLAALAGAPGVTVAHRFPDGGVLLDIRASGTP